MPLLDYFFEPKPSPERSGESLHALRPRQSALLSLLIALVLAVVFCFVHPAVFETNDDPAILSFAYGLHGQRDPHLIFVNIILGRILIALIQLFPHAAWYTLFQIALVTVSFAVIFYLFFQRFGLRNAWFPLAFIIFCYSFQYYSLLQFTREAGIASLAGMLLLFHGAAESDRWRSIICGFLLTVFGSLWRFKAMGMLLLPLFGVGLYHLVPLLKKKDWPKVLRLVGVFAVTLVTCFLLFLYDAAVYDRDPAWRDYTEFNALRSELLDRGFPDYEDNEELYGRLDIAPADLEMYRQWDFDDTEIFTTEALRALVDAKGKTDAERNVLKDFVLILLSRISGYWYLLCGLLPAALLCLFSRKKSSVFLLFYEGSSFLLLELYLMLVGRTSTYRLLPRLEISLLLSCTVILFLFGFRFPREFRRWVAVCLAAGTALSCAWYVYHFRNSTDTVTADREKELMADLHEDRGRLYLITTVSVSDIAGIWEARPLGMHDNIDYLGGWRTRSPAKNCVYERFGVSNPFRDVVDNPALCYVAANDTGIRLQADYIRRHYAPTAEAYCVRIDADDYGVYRILSRPPAPDPDEAAAEPGRVVFEPDPVREEGGGVRLSGMLYVRGDPCYDSMLFLQTTDSRGNTELSLLPLLRRADDDPRPEGKFVFYDTLVPKPESGTELSLVISSASGTYRVPLETAIGN